MTFGKIPASRGGAGEQGGLLGLLAMSSVLSFHFLEFCFPEEGIEPCNSLGSGDSRILVVSLKRSHARA